MNVTVNMIAQRSFAVEAALHRMASDPTAAPCVARGRSATFEQRHRAVSDGVRRMDRRPPHPSLGTH